jgi:hypothetical protein
MNYKRVGPYRLFFTSNDLDEPPHIHIERDGMVAKFWLSPVQLAKSALCVLRTDEDGADRARRTREYHGDVA